LRWTVRIWLETMFKFNFTTLGGQISFHWRTNNVKLCVIKTVGQECFGFIYPAQDLNREGRYKAALKHTIARKTDELLTNQENSRIQACEKPQLIYPETVKVKWIAYGNLSRTSQKTNYIHVSSFCWRWSVEIVVCTEKEMKLTNTFYRLNANLFNFEAGGMYNYHCLLNVWKIYINVCCS